MNGQRALIYSRIRENRLNPRENDFTRGARQQAVMQAATSKLTSPGVLVAAAVQGRLAAEAAHDRPDGRAAAPARLGEEARVGRQHALLPARRRPVVRGRRSR